jgi:hypothetical protein
LAAWACAITPSCSATKAVVALLLLHLAELLLDERVVLGLLGHDAHLVGDELLVALGLLHLLHLLGDEGAVVGRLLDSCCAGHHAHLERDELLVALLGRHDVDLLGDEGVVAGGRLRRLLGAALVDLGQRRVDRGVAEVAHRPLEDHVAQLGEVAQPLGQQVRVARAERVQVGQHRGLAAVLGGGLRHRHGGGEVFVLLLVVVERAIHGRGPPAAYRIRWAAEFSPLATSLIRRSPGRPTSACVPGVAV